MKYIVYATDDNYVMMATVSICSLLVNNSSGLEYFFYILSDNITEDNRNKLMDLCKKYGANIEFINVVPKLNLLEKTFHVPAWNNNSFSAYSRLFIGELIPDIIDEVTYFDCDTLIKDDLSEYFAIKFEDDKVLIGVKDIICNSDLKHKKNVGLNRDTPYINSGVIRINLVNFRKNLCSKRLIDHIKNVRADYPFVDQDFLNVVLKDEIQIVAPKWNFLSVCYPFSVNQLYFMYGVKGKDFYEKKSFSLKKENIAVIHYVGVVFDRPWFSDSNNPLKSEWMNYLQETPYKDIVLGRAPRSRRFKMINICFRLLPRSIFVAIYKYMRLIADIKEND